MKIAFDVTTKKAEDPRANMERELNTTAAEARKGWHGADTTANIRRLRAAKGHVEHPEHEAAGQARRDAAAARAAQTRPKTDADRIAELEQRVKELEATFTPRHMRDVERR